MNKHTQPLANLVVSKGLQTGPFGSQLKAEEYTEDGIPVVMPKDIYGGKIKTDTIARTSIEKAKSLQKHFLQEGDILFPRRGDLGRIAVASKDNEGWICGTGCLRARLSVEVLPKYIHQFVQMPQVVRWLENNALGQTMLNLNTTIIGELPVYAPLMETQESIADALQTWDNAIEKTEALITAKEKQFEWLMEKLFKPNDTWTPYRLGELFDNRKETHNTDLPLVSITREKGVIPHSETNRKDNSSEDKSKYLRIRPDDIGYNTMRMWQGVSALSGIDGIVSPAYTICIPKKIVDPEFMAFLFKTKPMIHRFYRYSQGLTSDTWNLKFHHFCEVKAEIPDIETQVEIAQILNTAKHEIDLIKKTLEQYRSQKRGLMQKLLTGEWQVSSTQPGAEGALQELAKESVA